MTTGSDIVATARSYAGHFYYTNDWWSRMNPLESGGTDCSGFCRFIYGLYGYDIGTWTGDESQAGYEVARGHYPSEIPWDSLNPGDLIFMTATYWNNYNFDQYLCHVEIYCGDGTMIGHPGGYGPQEKWAQAWMEAYGCITWKVMRIVESEDDMRAADVWEYNYKNSAPGGNMYNCATNTNANVAALVNDVLRKDMSDVAKNTGVNVNSGAGMHERLAYCEAYIRQIMAKIDKIQPSNNTATVNIDYDKLANKVADVIYARMKQ